MEEWWLKSGWIILIVNAAIISLAASLNYLRWLFFRPKNNDEVIVAQYQAPKNLRPLEIGTLMDNKVCSHDVSGEIMQLCLDGVIKIEKIGKDWRLQKLRDLNKEDPYFDRLLMNLFFQISDYGYLSEIQGDFDPYFKSIKQATFESLISKGYYYPDSLDVLKRYNKLAKVVLQIAGGLGFGISFFYAVKIFDSLDSNVFIASIGAIIAILLISPSVIISFILTNMTNRNLVRLSAMGQEVKQQVLGLKKYIDVAEKDRINFYVNNQNTPESLLTLLPYAIAFSLEKKWSEILKEYYGQLPENIVVSEGLANDFADVIMSFVNLSLSAVISKEDL